MQKFYAVLAMLCFGIAPLLYKQGIDRLDNVFVAILWHNASVTVVLIMVFMAGKERTSYFSVQPTTLLWIATGAILTSALAQGFFYKALQLGSASSVVVIIACYPAFTFMIEKIMQRRTPTLWSLLGMVLLIGGLILINRGN